MFSSQKWVQSRISQIKAASPDSTVAIVSTVDEIARKDFKETINSLCCSEEFMADLKMQQAQWFYHDTNRTLLVAKKSDKEDAKPEEA